MINQVHLEVLIMAEFRVVISTKDGKSYQREVKEQAAKQFIGKVIGDTVKGETIDLPGYEMKITGAADTCGFPQRADVPGVGRKKVLEVKGIGVKKKSHGQRQRKTVRGNTISSFTAQISMKVLKEGKTPLGEAKTDAKGEASE